MKSGCEKCLLLFEADIDTNDFALASIRFDKIDAIIKEVLEWDMTKKTKYIFLKRLEVKCAKRIEELKTKDDFRIGGR